MNIKNSQKVFLTILTGLVSLTAGTGLLRAATIFVPNDSFEGPATDFAGPFMDAWQKAAKPFWYTNDDNGQFGWNNVMGQFLNTPDGAPDHIDNMEGSQGAYLFALPDVAIFQDYNSLAGTGTTPAHDFNARFEAGKSYALTVGVLGGGGGMSNGATFALSLYYQDAASNRITVATTTITNSPALFPVHTHFTDFQVRIPPVRPGDAWAGKNIGIQLASAITLLDDLIGGYWDLDNVRLTESVVPNDSFEGPATDFAGPFMDAWQKAAKPFWYTNDDNGQFGWNNVMGQFLNTPDGAPDHIDNMEGSQGAYLFALPDVAIFQDYNSLAGTGTTPAHDFNARFEAGKSYALTVGVLGGGGGMSNGATFALSLYYQDAASNRITVATTTITNSPALFPVHTHFTDFQVRIPPVRPGDAWAGKNIGIQLASAITLLDDLIGGYWDLDNVRLTESVVPNDSFEGPATDFAGPFMDAWQKAAKPFWYTNDDNGQFGWNNVMGQFLNTPDGAPDHIDNMEGSQGAYLFALPDVAIFQDYNSLAGTGTTPAHDFNARFEAGKSYALTVGVLGGGGGMSNGATFALSLYYQDAASNRITVATTTITNSPALFPVHTHFTDFQVRIPPVRPGDAWAGKNIGIQLASAITLLDDLIGGYWDLDNVRLTEVRDPTLNEFTAISNQQFQFMLQSLPGRYEILASTNVTLPVSTWSSLGVITNFTGAIPITDTNLGRRFYQARTSP